MEEKQLSFEEKMQRLESLVRKLEEGQLPLEDSLRAYETAMALSKELESELDAAQKRVMVYDGESGTVSPLPAEDLQ